MDPLVTYPDVEFPGKDAFGEAGRVDESTEDVEGGHQAKPAEGGRAERVPEPLKQHVVNCGHDAR